MDGMKYPIGIQTFSEIREEGYVYVDKTKYIYDLATKGKYYFLSRPRRFGKSLLLSTIEAFFSGRKELFEGLYVYDRSWDWIQYPVFHFKLNGQDYSSVEKFDEKVNLYMEKWEEAYGIKPYADGSSPIRFSNLIYQVFRSTGRKVVVLIDEYDQPLLQNIEQGKEDLHKSMREHLQAFYSVIKEQDEYIRFGMLTGVSKFSKVSVFSGLNNINDISLDERPNAICGISETEILQYFEESIASLAIENEMTIDETRDKLKKEYDGYHFSKSGEGIYNPFSLLNTFDKSDFNHYWIETGTPSFLISLLKHTQWKLEDISGYKCTEADIKGADRYLANPVPLLFQSGYITIKSYDKRFKQFTLDYPNDEVAEGFSNDLLKALCHDRDTNPLILEFVTAVESGDAKTFMATLQSLLADVPYDQILNKELHYENMMYLVMKLMGFYVHTEYKTSNGRIDMVIDTNLYTYIIEFKLHGTAEEAIRQIQEKEYAMPFINKGKEIVLIGAAFSEEKRRLESWIIK